VKVIGWLILPGLGDAEQETDGGAGVMLYDPLIVVPRMLVPTPSFFKTFAPAAKETLVEPRAIPLKFMVRMVPVPEKPGFGKPPEKFMVPVALEKEGYSGHRVKIELPVLTEETLSRVLSKFIVASAALIKSPPVFTETFIEKLFPKAYDPLAGLKYRFAAAKTLEGEAIRAQKTIATIK
jgi:hypothetical protein